MTAQPGILRPLPRLARYLAFRLLPGAEARPALEALSREPLGDDVVVGMGPSLATVLGASIDGLRELPRCEKSFVDVPVTPRSMLVWLRGDDRGSLIHRGRQLSQLLGPAFVVEESIDAFQHLDSRDLSGFEDGTENPLGSAAENAALVKGRGAGLDDSSFLAVQKWVHDLDALEAMGDAEQSLVIGRDKITNEELADAPPSAHVKRTAQESFAPPAFVVRRSMPWSDGREHGLMFSAFGKSLDAFEALLRRMVGGEDGVADALFRFTRPATGATFWCPPLDEGCLDLRVILGMRPLRSS